MDYEKAYEEMKNVSETWKPEVGVHNVIILAEPEPTSFTDEKTGEITPQIKLFIEVAGKQYNWFVSKGVTEKSVYGQLMTLGKFKGKLASETIQVLITQSKNKNGEMRNSYTISEAVIAMQELKKLETTPEVIS